MLRFYVKQNMWTIPLFPDETLQVQRKTLDEFVRMLISNQVFIDNVLNGENREFITLTLHVGAGESTQQTVKVPYGISWQQAQEYIADPYLEYHVFDHWSTEEDGGEIDPEKLLTLDLELWANYTRKRVTIHFNGNLGLIRPDDLGVDAGTTWAEVMNQITAYRVEYALVGFSTTLGGSLLEDSFIVEENMTVYAQWTDWNKIPVTFDSNGGIPEEYDTIIVQPGDTWSMIADSVPKPSKDGHNFVGWSIKNEEDSINPIIPSNYPFREALTLFAQYSNKNWLILISFNTQGGSDILPINAWYGATLKEAVQGSGIPKKEYNRFLGWSLDPDGEPLPDDYILTEAVNLYAIWDDTRRVTLHFVTDSADTFDDMHLAEGLVWATDILPLVNTPSKTDWKFMHWSLSDNGEPIPDDYVFSGGVINIYAVWEKAEVITITFDGNGGVPEAQGIQVAVGVQWNVIKDQIQPPTKYNHVFDFWTIDGEEIADDHAFEWSTTCIASYTEVAATITLTFDGDIGVPKMQQIQVANGSTWAKIKEQIEDPFVANQLFLGWYYDSILIVDDFIFDRSAIFTAKYKPETVELTFVSSGEPAEQKLVVPKNISWETLTSDPQYVIVQPHKDRYDFIEWQLRGFAILPKQLFAVDTTIEAYFEPQFETVDLTFIADGEIFFEDTVEKGTLWRNVIDKVSDTGSADNSPHKDGYRFLYWTLEGSSEKCDLDHAFNENATLVAFFDEIRAKVTLTFSGGENSEPETQVVEVDYGATWNTTKDRVQNPTRSDALFVRWLYTDVYETKELIDSTIFLGDWNISADWNISVVKLIAHNGDLSVPPTETVLVETWKKFYDVQNRLTIPTKEDYLFDYWSLTENGVKVPDDFTIMTNDVDVYAVFKYNMVTIDPQTFASAVDAYKFEKGKTWAEVKEHFPAPVKENNSFAHWSLEPDGNPIEDGYVFRQDTVQIFAVWVPYIELSFDVNGGTPLLEPILIPKDSTWGSVKNSFTAPTRLYYELDYWSINGLEVAMLDDYVISENTTIRAMWRRKQVHLIFNGNGGAPDRQELYVDMGSTFGENRAKLQVPFKSDTETFAYWSIGSVVITDAYLLVDDEEFLAQYRTKQIENMDTDMLNEIVRPRTVHGNTFYVRDVMRYTGDLCYLEEGDQFAVIIDLEGVDVGALKKFFLRLKSTDIDVMYTRADYGTKRITLGIRVPSDPVDGEVPVTLTGLVRWNGSGVSFNKEFLNVIANTGISMDGIKQIEKEVIENIKKLVATEQKHSPEARDARDKEGRENRLYYNRMQNMRGSYINDNPMDIERRSQRRFYRGR